MQPWSGHDRRRRCRPRWVLILLAGLPAFQLAAELTPSEARGKQIYHEGSSPAGSDITAVIGDAGTEVSAAIMPCGSCHGADGRGRPEGGVSPSDLTWPALTKPYRVERADGRQHPPYTQRLLVRAITMGLDPAGNSLHVAMPRYRLTHQDVGDLVAYLKRLDSDLDPGLTDTSITLATQLPRDGALESLGGAIEAILQAYFDDLNQRGGIYSRQIDLRVMPAPVAAEDRVSTLRSELQSDEVFALVGTFLPGAEQEITDLVEDMRVPLVGPFTQHPQLGFPLNPYVFYLLPGLEDLGRAMVGHATEEGADRTAVVVDSQSRFEPAAEAILDRLAELDRDANIQSNNLKLELNGLDPAHLGERPDHIFLLANGEQQTAFFQQAAAASWYPRVFLPGSLLGRETFDAPAGFDQRIHLAFPTLPGNQAAASTEAYRDLAVRYSLPTRHVTAQIATLASARVLVEGLKRSGRELSRRRLVEALEGLSEFDNGLTPLVSYGPNRRVGVNGTYMLALDLTRQRLMSASGWVESN